MALQQRGPRDPLVRNAFLGYAAAYDYAEAKKYRRAVSILVLKETEVCTPTGCGIVDQILLVRKPRPSDAWQLPQGGIEEGETCEQAALRELLEETGLRLDAVIHSSSETYCYDFPPDFIASEAKR